MTNDLAPRIAAAIRAPWKALARQDGWPIERWQAEAVLVCLRSWRPDMLVIEPSDRIEVQGHVFYTSSGDVSLPNGTYVSLSPREAALLEVLVRNAGVVVPRRQIMRAVWGTTEERSNLVQLYVGYVRKKLPTLMIKTRQGFGYVVPKDLEVAG